MSFFSPLSQKDMYLRLRWTQNIFFVFSDVHFLKQLPRVFYSNFNPTFRLLEPTHVEILSLFLYWQNIWGITES